MEEQERRIWLARLRQGSTAALLARYADVCAELRRRKVGRTNNPPAGEYAELLIARALGGTLAEDPSEKGWDVKSPEHGRLQVKARVTSDPEKRGDRQLSVIRGFDFEKLAVVLFKPDYTVGQAALLPVTFVESKKGQFIARVGGWYVFATESFFRDALQQGVLEDITEALRAAASDLPASE